MSKALTLTPTEAMQQASETAHYFTCAAVRQLKEFSAGKGVYLATDDDVLRRHPKIVAAMVLAASSDYRAWVLHMAAERLATAIEEAGETICKGMS